MYNLLSVLLVIIGFIGVIYSQCINKNYIIKDLLLGLGMYSIVVGLIMMHPTKINSIFIVYYIIGILQTIYILKMLGYSGYYVYSIISTIIAVMMMLHKPLEIPK